MRFPQLLMVSGVGPAHILDSVGIPILVDRPGVGQNMWVRKLHTLCARPFGTGVLTHTAFQDNILVGPTFEVNVKTHSALEEPAYLAEAVEEYSVNRTGMLTNVGGDFAGRYSILVEAAKSIDEIPGMFPS